MGYICKEENGEWIGCTSTFIVLGDGTQISVEQYENATEEEKNELASEMAPYHYYYREQNPLEENIE